MLLQSRDSVEVNLLLAQMVSIAAVLPKKPPGEQSGQVLPALLQELGGFAQFPPPNTAAQAGLLQGSPGPLQGARSLTMRLLPSAEFLPECEKPRELLFHPRQPFDEPLIIIPSGIQIAPDSLQLLPDS